MAGLVPAIHDPSRDAKNVDARDKPGHEEIVARVEFPTNDHQEEGQFAWDRTSS
jgi:hypothetical protein